MLLNSVSRSLSTKLLLWTILYVMLAEVLIFTPSVARFRLTYLEEKQSAAHLAALAVEAAPDLMVTDVLEAKLLRQVGAHAIDLAMPDDRVYMLSSTMPPRIDATYDLGTAGFFGLIEDAFAALGRRDDRAIKIVGPSPKDHRLHVEVVIDERPMIDAMRDFAGRILALSIGISLFTATLVFLTLNGLFVRPLRRLTESVVAFRADPENARAPFSLEYRRDEIGVAQRELVMMQDALRTALRQRERLAALGTAVAKINHDLRAILSTAALLSEHLAESSDPEARRVTPRLMASIDRAVELCGQTLSYTQDGVLPLEVREIDLRALVEEAGDIVLGGNRPSADAPPPLWENLLPDGLRLRGDPVQLSRALVNLGRNAIQAGADRVTVRLREPTPPETERLTLVVTDGGPGLPPRALANLFQPFTGSARAGGVGLGLAIAREIARAHGGDLRLVDTSAAGTAFALELPVGRASRG